VNTDVSDFDAYLNSGKLNDAEKWLKSKKWYAYDYNLPLIRRFWRENFKKRPLLRLHAVIPDNDAILKAVENSDGLAVSSDLIADKALKQGLVKVLWNGNVTATNAIYLAYNKNKIQPLYVEKVKNFIISNIHNSIK
jgi:DNA-binding transcriptional LysR family regulator